jgi:hypothetical protein
MIDHLVRPHYILYKLIIRWLLFDINYQIMDRFRIMKFQIHYDLTDKTRQKAHSLSIMKVLYIPEIQRLYKYICFDTRPEFPLTYMNHADRTIYL